MAGTGQRDGGHRTETPDVAHIQNPSVSHEASDVNVRALLTFVGGLTAFAIVVHLLMWGMFRVLNSRAEALEPRPAPLAFSEQELAPAPPVLQVAPSDTVELPNGKKVDLARKEPQAEYQVVKEYWGEVLANGPKDQNGRSLGMPIKEAMRQLVQQGLPARQQQAGTSPLDYATEMPTFQSSGRMSVKRDE